MIVINREFVIDGKTYSLSFEHSFFANCVICKKYAYGELVAGHFICYKCVFPSRPQGKSIESLDPNCYKKR